MAEYRPIKNKVWHDEWFTSLDIEEKLFWLFLLTNEYVHISGIYELPKPLLSPLSGCPKALEIIQKFQEQGKVEYKNGYIFLKNYIKNQTQQINKKDNIIKSIISYLSENPQLISLFNLTKEAPYKPLISPLGKDERIKEERGKRKDIMSDIKSDEENLPFNFQSLISSMEGNKDKRMPIIALYWKVKGMIPENREQYNSMLRRELRPAKELIGYTLPRIREIMDYLQKMADFKWTLESVMKYVNENIETLETLKMTEEEKIRYYLSKPLKK